MSCELVAQVEKFKPLEIANGSHFASLTLTLYPAQIHCYSHTALTLYEKCIDNLLCIVCENTFRVSLLPKASKVLHWASKSNNYEAITQIAFSRADVGSG